MKIKPEKTIDMLDGGAPTNDMKPQPEYDQKKVIAHELVQVRAHKRATPLARQKHPNKPSQPVEMRFLEGKD